MSRQERASRTRHLIIQAAAQAFDLEGFARTGLSEIAQLCGVSKGALYFHFGSKEQLADAVMAESRMSLREIIRRVRAPRACGLQYLIDLCHGLTRQLDQDVVFRAGLRLTEEPGLAGEDRPSPYPAWERLIGRQLVRAARDADIHPEVLLAEVTALLAAASVGIETLSRRDKGWLGSHVTTGLWNAVLPALTPVDRLGRIRTAPESAGLALPSQSPPPGGQHWDVLPEVAAVLTARTDGS